MNGGRRSISQEGRSKKTAIRPKESIVRRKDSDRLAPISLHPLDLETALGAALKTGRPPDLKKRPGAGKRHKT
jgi:hypothetical protein